MPPMAELRVRRDAFISRGVYAVRDQNAQLWDAKDKRPDCSTLGQTGQNGTASTHFDNFKQESDKVSRLS